jgi:hypothetical protein
MSSSLRSKREHASGKMTLELKQSKQCVRNLRDSNTVQTARIHEPERSANDPPAAVWECQQDADLKSGMEYILGELRRNKAINEENNTAIEKHEEERH